ncbi:UNKNOWN [Stylonychia lemnae]|uniref:Uncharacterized protein n=1 Tax=Stylonychia lemnae TaxID=5949 RepID=A0A078B166_STYLE|nr:UNKNOWN [Stylonychia lemnae]|eukprot:CDW88071.1 UNKNOWN [Stylonychia lemnae]
MIASHKALLVHNFTVLLDSSDLQHKKLRLRPFKATTLDNFYATQGSLNRLMIYFVSTTKIQVGKQDECQQYLWKQLLILDFRGSRSVQSLLLIIREGKIQILLDSPFSHQFPNWFKFVQVILELVVNTLDSNLFRSNLQIHQSMNFDSAEQSGVSGLNNFNPKYWICNGLIWRLLVGELSPRNN